MVGLANIKNIWRILIDKMNKLKSLNKCIYLYVVIALLGIMYISLCFNHNIWTDEAFTLQVMREARSVPAVWEYIKHDSHPPFYYLMVRVFTLIFGESILSVKVFSIIPMLLTMGFGPVVLYKKMGFKIALMYEVLLGTLPCLMEYAIQPRMYTWAMLFVTLCGFFGYKAVLLEGRIKDFILFALFGTLSAYTHYFAFAAVLWIYGIAFLIVIYKRTKRYILGWLLVCLCSALMYLPWFKAMAVQVSTGDENWIDPVYNFKTILGYFNWLVDIDIPCQSVAFGVLFLLSIILLVINHKNSEIKVAIYSLLIPVLVVVTGVVLSVAIRPIFVMRYIVPAAGLLCIFLAISFSYLPNRAYIALLIFWIFVGGITYKETWYDEYNSTLTPNTEAFFAENLKEGDIVSYNWKVYHFAYEYYFDNDMLFYIEDIDFNNPEITTVYLLDTAMNPEPDMDVLGSLGFVMEDMGAYGIEQNDFEIYKIYR